MRIVVAVVVYNRFENIKRWLKVWGMADRQGAELVIIHNYYGNEAEKQRLQQICSGVTYIPRNAPGFDVGAFQDVCRGRLTRMPEYDYILWCCDDTIPVSIDFISPFINTITEPGVGIAAMQIAVSIRGETHVRTTGYMVSKKVAERLVFPADPLTTKQECYLFEHRGQNTMTWQIRQMGLSCKQVAPNQTSPLWDVGYWKRVNRQTDFDSLYSEQSNNRVVFIVPIYNMYPQIISSLICQTNKNWELLLIHNGPCTDDLRMTIKNYNEPRVKFIEYPEETGRWGHVLRQWALNEIRNGNLSTADYVVISNADNYYTPPFIDYMLKGFAKSHTAVATYCDSVVHSYIAWKVMPSRFERGHIDCGQVMIKTNVAAEVGWKDVDSHSSDWTFFSDIASRYSSRNFIAVKGTLFVHNVILLTLIMSFLYAL